MRILFVTLSVGERVRSPEMELAEELARMGNEVTLVINPGSPYLAEKHPDGLTAYEMEIQATRLSESEIRLLSKRNYDIVYGGIEGATDVTLQLGECFEIPVVNHIEFFPPWRVGLEPAERWGFSSFPDYEIERYRAFYRHHAENLARSDLVTIGSAVLKQNVYAFLRMCGLPRFRLEVMHLGVDDHTADSVPSQEEECGVIFIGRLVPTKKLFHLIRALTLVEDTPILRIIGSGEMEGPLETFAKRMNIHVDLLGGFSGSRKFEEIKRSALGFQSWGSLPPAEYLYSGKPCVCYTSPYMASLFGDTLEWVPWDSVYELADEIRWLMENPGYREERGLKGREAIVHRQVGIWTLRDAAKYFEKILERVL